MSDLIPSSSDAVKERISTNLKQAKEEGSLRADRIREIMQAAVSQALSELKEGSQEVRPVVKDAFSAVLEVVGGKGKEVQNEVLAAVEGLVDGISHSRRQNLTEAESKVQQLQQEVDQQSQLLESEVDTVLTDIQETGTSSSKDFNALIHDAVKVVKEKEEFSILRQQYARLKSQLETIEANLEAKYGDRYDEAKRHLENAKTWYAKTKVEAEAQGTDPLKKKQDELEGRVAEAGVAIARKEQQIKQLLRDLLHTSTSKR
ncbi:MAG TPA: histidine kinase [Coleofasciculaceae cyanobacterium]